MKICYFGDYDKDYPRHVVLLRAFKNFGADIQEVQVQRSGWQKYIDRFIKIFTIDKDVDLIFFGYSNSRFVWLLKIFSRKPVVWNAFYSLYDNWVHDRKRAKEGSVYASFLWFLDWLCCFASDIIVLETTADIDYFVRTYGASRKKFLRVPVGFDDQIFKPVNAAEKSPDKFIVEFHGRYIPVQGVKHIIEAADILKGEKSIHFILIGNGQTFASDKALAESLRLDNIEFLDAVPKDHIPKYVANADVCIGLLGAIPRVNQAIPNKIFEAAAMGRACINADTDAIREVFTDEVDILLVERGNSRDLAEKILYLKNNQSLKNLIAASALRTVNNHASILVIGQILKDNLMKLTKS